MTKLARMTEAQLTSSILELASVLKWRGHHQRPGRTKAGWRTAVQATPGHGKGWPDLLLIHERTGRQLVAELKVRREKLTAEQLEWLDAFATTEAETHAWWDTDWTDGTIEAALRMREDRRRWVVGSLRVVGAERDVEELRASEARRLGCAVGKRWATARDEAQRPRWVRAGPP